MLRFSIILNCLLLPALIASVLWQSWLLASCRDGRPAGPSLTLQHDYPIYDASSGALSFTLPRGTRLQESTPQGAATLGKTHGREYLVILHSDDSDFHPPDQRKELGWVSPYRFDVTK